MNQLYTPLACASLALASAMGSSPAAGGAGRQLLYTMSGNDELRTAVKAWCKGDESTYGNISTWDTSQVTNMNDLFSEMYCSTYETFNNDLSSFDTSRVTTMKRMFSGASSFNCDVSTFDTSRVTDMEQMFNKASSFNRDLSSFDTSSVKDMGQMFKGATSFNVYVSSFDVRRVRNMENMFNGASSFAQCVEWDIRAVPNGKKVNLFKGSQGSFCGTCGRDGQWAKSDDAICVDCPIAAACDGSTECLKDSKLVGFACGSCKAGRFLLNDQCRKCPAWEKYAWLIGAAFAALVCWLIYRHSDGEADMSSLTIACSYFQVTYIYFSFKLSYPDFVLKIAHWVLGVFSFAFADLSSPECSVGGAEQYPQRWWFSAVAPLLAMLPFAVKLCVLDRREGFRREKTIHTLVVLATITYVHAMSAAMEPWDCREYADGTWRLDGDPNLQCSQNSPSWQGMMAGSVFLFVGYVFGFNRLLKDVIDNADEGDHIEYEKRKKEFGFVFLRYKDDHRNWELVSNFRKLLTVVVQVFLSHSGIAQAVMTIAAIILIMRAHYNRQPYRRESSNTLEFRLLILELLLVIFALIGEGSGLGDASVSLILLTVVGVGIVLVAKAVVHEYLKQRRQEHMDRPNSASWDSLGSIMDVELVKANARANAEALAESETEETYAEVEVTAMVAADRI